MKATAAKLNEKLLALDAELDRLRKQQKRKVDKASRKKADKQKQAVGEHVGQEVAKDKQETRGSKQ